MKTQPTYCVRIPGRACWADHLRSLFEAQDARRTAERTTGMHWSIWIVTASGEAKEVSK
jgi:hypothetical protein